MKSVFQSLLMAGSTWLPDPDAIAQQQELFRRSRLAAKQLSTETWMMVGRRGNLGWAGGMGCSWSTTSSRRSRRKSWRPSERSATSRSKFVSIRTAFDPRAGNDTWAKAGGPDIRARNSAQADVDRAYRIPNMGPRPTQGSRCRWSRSPTTSRYTRTATRSTSSTCPAPTDGDAIIHFRTSNVIHRATRSSTMLFPVPRNSSGGHRDGMSDAVDPRAGWRRQHELIPGHGPLGTRPKLTAYRSMIRR